MPSLLLSYFFSDSVSHIPNRPQTLNLDLFLMNLDLFLNGSDNITEIWSVSPWLVYPRDFVHTRIKTKLHFQPHKARSTYTV